jgi:hypothetical protein
MAQSEPRPGIDCGRPATGSELVEHDAQRINVCGRSRRIESACLRREITRRPAAACVARSIAPSAYFAGYRDRAEIGKPRVNTKVRRRGKQDVLRLHIAMDDPGDMEPGQSTCDLTSDGDRLWGWEQSSSQHLAQGLSLDQLRHQGDDAVVENKIVNRDEMRVHDPGQRGPLPDKPADELRVMAESLMEDLDGNLATSGAVGGAPDRPGSTAADLRDQGVAAGQLVIRTQPRIASASSDHCRKVAAMLASACT